MVILRSTVACARPRGRLVCGAGAPMPGSRWLAWSSAAPGGLPLPRVERRS